MFAVPIDATEAGRCLRSTLITMDKNFEATAPVDLQLPKPWSPPAKIRPG